MTTPSGGQRKRGSWACLILVLGALVGVLFIHLPMMNLSLDPPGVNDNNDSNVVDGHAHIIVTPPPSSLRPTHHPTTKPTAAPTTTSSPSTTSPTTASPTTASPTTTSPTTPAPTFDLVTNFTCLQDDDDDDEDVWRRRVARSRQFRHEHCSGQPVDEFATPTTQTTVPVIFVYWINAGAGPSVNTRNTLTLVLNTAARFNNDVILLLFGREQDLALNSSALRRNVRIHQVLEGDTGGPIRAAFNSFNSSSPYIHHSPNSVQYELACFQRWFGALEFVQQRQVSYDRVFFADNDVLLMTNVTQEANECFVGCRGFGWLVYATYFDVGHLRDFVSYIRSFYNDDDGAHGRREQRIQYMMHKYHVVSDMTLHMEFSLQHYTSRNVTNTQDMACTWAKKTLNSLTPRRPFDGGFERAFFQDELGLAYATAPGLRPNMLPVLHFQYDRKQFLEACWKKK